MSNIRVIKKSGKAKGKKVVVMVGVHGNETCGPIALDSILPNIEIEKGEVTFIYANLNALNKGKRFLESNLNRLFLDKIPSSEKKTIEGMTAKEIIPYLKEADILLDIHSSKSSEGKDYIICEKNCDDIAKYLSSPKVIYGIDQHHTGGSDIYMFNRGKKGICLECGIHKSKKSIKIAKQSINEFLIAVGAIKGIKRIQKTKERFEVEYLYRSKYGAFTLAKKFKDFEELKSRMLIGYDGDNEIWEDKGKHIIFPDNPKKVGNECFVIMKKLKSF
jgi:succinylglutamate desuccinylase